MSNTPAHDLSCVLLAGCQVGIAIVLQDHRLLLTAIGSGTGLMLSPDLDWNAKRLSTGRMRLDNVGLGDVFSGEKNLVFSKIARRWPSPLKEWWFVYAILMRHRRMSHKPVWGTLTRLLWLIFPVPLTILLPDLLWVWVGLTLADILHAILDFWF